MNQSNVHSKSGITLVGGGDPDPSDIVEAVSFAPFVVAADGGADFCREADIDPAVVIGDLDSVSDTARAALPSVRFLQIPEQDTTDFEKCLSAIEAPFVLATGFTDGRLDHTLAALSVLARRIGPPTIVIGKEEVIFAAPASLSLKLPEGTRVSVFPMASVTGRSSGLRWPIDGLTLDPMGRVGTSNIATGPVAFDFKTPGALVLIPKAFLAEAISALTG
ncbi:MAG: thiamine diphosphokinase [Silicimonas sp.]|nr:thiamine diphosphokinase [Silicimonas sp.]